jgi:hypothetical protein
MSAFLDQCHRRSRRRSRTDLIRRIPIRPIRQHRTRRIHRTRRAIQIQAASRTGQMAAAAEGQTHD